MSDIGYIVDHGHEVMYAYFESQIDAGLVSRDALDKYLLKYYGELYDLWIDWMGTV